MEEKREELLKIIDALQDELALLNSYLGIGSEDEEIEIIDDEEVEEEELPEDEEAAEEEEVEEVEEVEEEPAEEEVEVEEESEDEVDEGLLDKAKNVLNPLAPVKAVVGAVKGAAKGAFGEECESCDEELEEEVEAEKVEEVAEEEVEEGLLGGALAGLGAGAGLAAGNKIMNKILGEEDEDVFEEEEEVEVDESLIEEDEDEATTGEKAKEVAAAIGSYFKDNEVGDNDKANAACEIIDAIPADFVDDLIKGFKDTFGNKEITPEVRDQAEKKGFDLSGFDKYNDFVDKMLNDPKFAKTGKGIILAVLGIISIVEPSPVGEIITGVIALIPADVLMKIVHYSNLANLVIAIINWFRKKKQQNEAVEEDEVDESLFGLLNPLAPVKAIGGALGGAAKGLFGEECEECEEGSKKEAALREARLSDFEDEFDLYITDRLAEKMFYRDAYILIEPNEENLDQGTEVIYVDGDQVIYLYNESKDEDVDHRYVESDIEVKEEIARMLKSYIDISKVGAIKCKRGRYYR